METLFHTSPSFEDRVREAFSATHRRIAAMEGRVDRLEGTVEDGVRLLSQQMANLGRDVAKNTEITAQARDVAEVWAGTRQAARLGYWLARGVTALAVGSAALSAGWWAITHFGQQP